MEVDDFNAEIETALKAYDKFIVNIAKPPDDFHAAMRSLMQKAIDVYQKRQPHQRHGIALDRHVTVILSENDGKKPLCGIYFNLHSPYKKQQPT
jgi:hypothetical protein